MPPAEFVGVWEEIKAEEERRAAEEAELFKSKARSTEIQTEEQVRACVHPTSNQLGQWLMRLWCSAVLVS